MLNKKALITGITGQDGRHLLHLLTKLDYEVWGLIRRCSNCGMIDEIKSINPNVKLRYGDLTDAASLRRIVKECRADEIYNLAAQSHVRISYDIPEYTSLANGTGVVNLLDAIKEYSPNSRFYQASTSEMFGSSNPPQNESTSFHPRSPYGVAKVQAYWAVVNHREAYDMFCSNGILFNHEGPMRGDDFVTRKITKSVAKIKLGLQDCLYLGNLDAKRDWGYAGDYVKAMHMMLQHDVPDDFVISTGEAHTVREFLLASFDALDMKVESNGKIGIEEVYYDESGSEVVKIDPRFFRPAEVDFLLGDSSKAKEVLGWYPETSFEQLVKIMVDNDYNLLNEDSFLAKGKIK
jgi:GDPmannose 4,6-dehydratase